MIIKIDLQVFQRYSSDILNLLVENYYINLPFFEDINKECEKKIDNLREYLINKTAICFGYVLNSQMKGFLWTYKIRFNTGFKIHVAHLIVSSELRSQGIGRQLFNAIDKEYQDNSSFIGYELFYIMS